jgi:hypothetical protein
MTMGIDSIEPPWMSICLIHTYQKKNIDIGALNRGKKIRCILVVWGKFYEVVQGWQAVFSNRQEEVHKRGGLKIK